MASTTGKNRSILAGLVGDAPAAVTNPPISAFGAEAKSMVGSSAEPAAPVIPPRVNDRMLGLSRLTSGDYEEKTLKLVDPARCRMWSRHNRRYALLNPTNTAELLEGLRAQNKQEFPAVVRRVTDDPAFDYEVIAGARRHWAVTYLREVEHREIKYLVDERDLTDEQAFRLADIENRARRDLSDYERAVDYRDAIEAFYGGQPIRMAERLEMSRAYLSRLLDLAKLPPEVVAAFGDLLVLRENHSRELKPVLADAQAKTRVIAAAKKLAKDQEARKASGEPLVEPRVVIALLKAAAQGAQEPKPGAQAARVVTNADNVALFTARAKPGRKLVLELSLDAKAPDADFLAAIEQELARLRAAT
uniref:ParB/RepB/Spo0J family partition protein n=1 Tax=uncultured Caulobacter sp. TaxID=158749 RepID=UPI0025EFB3FC|nr:ParB/RepB/Spo0J family partition protein [uncultured Caulobacter sp.]